jgi:RNA polymerase sigma-70 factor (ECF subfamily)
LVRENDMNASAQRIDKLSKGLEMDEFLVQIEKHKDEFYRYIYRMAWDSGVADDVFSSAVLAAYQNREKFTPGTNFRAWMYRIITNKCFVANRETGRAPDSLEDHEFHISALPTQPGYDDLLGRGEEVLEACSDEVVMAFRCLSTAERSCLLLRAMQSNSYQEIADILEIPVGTVMTHLSRGRAKLRKRLLEYATEAGIVKAMPLNLTGNDEQTEVLEYKEKRA